MILKYEQRVWLGKLFHHPKRMRWLTETEVGMVAIVLDAGVYNDTVQTNLQNIRDYYIKHKEWKGTLDNPTSI
jgi:hypothetical protein